MELRLDNPYAYGIEWLFDDGSSLLLREPLTIQAEGTDLRYSVQQGDTLSNIAGKYYKSSKLWWVIFDANNLVDPFNLEVGSLLVIPDLRRVKAILQ